MKKKHLSYLDQIQFDSALKNKPIYKYLTNIRFVILIVLTILLAGTASFIFLPRRLNPEVKIPIVVVSTVYPGAGPEDVESLVTIPLEDELSGIAGIDTVSSTSQENISILTLEFLSSVNGDDVETEVQSLVDKTLLPEDALTPSVSLIDFEDQPIWRFAVYTDSSNSSLQEFSRTLQNKIEDLSIVDRVVATGLEQQEISIIIDPKEVISYNIDPQTLSGLIRGNIKSFPIGNVKSNSTKFPVSIDAPAQAVTDIRNTKINVGGNVISLGDISTIELGSKPGNPKSYISKDGEVSQIIVLSVYKNTNEDISDASDQVKELVNAEISSYKGTYDILTIEDSAQDIADQFDELSSNFASTIFLVFVTLLVFLGIRQALIVAASIPLTFLISFIFMNTFGLSLNFLTLFSLLLALGLLVDDAIVIVSAMTSYYKTGKFTAAETGALVWRDFIVPIWSTTITTVWAFVPLLLSSGILGEFIKGIPIVVSSTLIASTSVAVLITLPVMILLLEPKIASRVKALGTILLGVLILSLANVFLPNSILKVPTLILILGLLYVLVKIRSSLFDILPKTQIKRIINALDKGLVNTDVIVSKYSNLLDKILSNKNNVKKTLLIVIIFSIFSYLLVPLGFVKNEFFPKSDFDLIYVNMELSSGTELSKTTEISLDLLQQMQGEDYVEYIILEPKRSIDPNDGGGSSSDNKAAFSVKLVDESIRPSSLEIAQDFRDKYKGYSKADVKVIELSGGPPAGADIQIKLLGDDLGTLQENADNVVAFLETQEGLVNVSKSIVPGATKLSFKSDTQKLSQNQLSSSALGFWLRTYLSGFELGELRIANDVYDITLRTTLDTLNASELEGLTLNAGGKTFYLSDYGEYELSSNPTVIVRENGKRSLSISAGVVVGYNIPELNTTLENYAKNELNLPQGYTWQIGGVNDENQKSVQSIMVAMILAAILILVTMVLQLGSFRKSLIVLLVIPLAISGVFIVFALTGTPLSFPALIGVLALFGIVVNNSIVVVEKINQNLAINMKLQESIIDASAGRLEPIFFSSLTTIIGLIPITISDPLWRGLGGAIIAGLIFSGIIMLLFIPSVYYVIYRSEID